MIIIVHTFSGHTVTRPDTTLNKNAAELYLPEFAGNPEWTPVIFAKLSGSGKYIAEKFASRYFDSIGFGMLIYPGALLDGSEEGFAAASCINQTSIIPLPAFAGLDYADRGVLRYFRDGEKIAEFATQDNVKQLCTSLACVSEGVFVKTADVVCREIAPRQALSEGGCVVSAEFEGKEIYKTKIIL